MRRRCRGFDAPCGAIRVYHLLLVPLALAVILVVVEWQRPFSSRYAEYVCVHCGAVRTLSRRAFAGITYSEHITVRESPVSRVLNPGLRRACQHGWYELSFGASASSLLGPGEIADGRSEFVLARMLVRDAHFARQLARTPHPQAVWEAICRAGQTSPRQADDLLLEGVYGDEAFAKWWAENETGARALSAAHAPARRR